MAGSAELDAMTSSPPNLGAPAQPNVSVADAAGSTPDNPLSLASLDPGVVSPYQPLSLPQEDQHPTELAPQQPIQNLGAVNHAGALAYMADNILRGVMQGHEQKVMRQQDQFNKKLEAQREIHEQIAKQYQQLKASGLGYLTDAAGNYIFGPDGRGIPTPVLTKLDSQRQAAFDAILQTMGSRIPQPKQKSGGKGKPASSASASKVARLPSREAPLQDHHPPRMLTIGA